MSAALSTADGFAGDGRVADLVSRYRPLQGIPDEFVDETGAPRPHWRAILDAVAHLPAEEIKRRFATADRHLRDTGVSYRLYGDTAESGGTDALSGERPWPLSHVPLVIAPADWRAIEAGIIQRARLAEAVLGDVYGPGRLVAEGRLPAAAITGSPDYLRAMHGYAPKDGFLRLYAVDLGRGPDGRWWVLGDRTQAPSGPGYALENRIALSRAFPDLYREMRVERLAGFFDRFRAGLAAMAERAEPRICLLTPGPLNQTYVEQAFLARYLGFLLVQGPDLAMHDGQLHVRTIAGLKRADVLWRRVDADFIDPLAFNPDSQIGVPGLMEAVRQGRLPMANGLGSGLMEAPALMSFLPALCRELLGEDLLLPNTATWWCGEASAREAVLAAFETRAIAPAFQSGPGAKPILPVMLDPTERAALAAEIEARGIDHVGQEVVQLSTMPVFEEGGLVPRPFSLRVYAALTPEGWQVMPGGFCRISDRSDVRAIAMREGVRSADVWVLAEGPVPQKSLLPPKEAVPIRRVLGNLPSRAADNLFWLGRYLERAEATIRLVRALLGRLLEGEAATPDGSAALSRLAGLLVAWGATPDSSAVQADRALASHALGKGGAPGSALVLVSEARRTAGAIRERLSAQAWRLLTDLDNQLQSVAMNGLTEAETLERAEQALRALAALAGLEQENMNRSAGWRFLQMGRRLERAIGTCRFARAFAGADTSVSDLDVLLDLSDCQITYRSRYLVGPVALPVRDLVVLDPFNPRSVAYQAAAIDDHIAALPVLRPDGVLETPRRLSLDLATRLQTLSAEALDWNAIFSVEQAFMALSDAIAARFFLQGPQAARAERLTGLA